MVDSVGGICLMLCISKWLCVVRRFRSLVNKKVLVILVSEKLFVVEIKKIVLGVDYVVIIGILKCYEKNSVFRFIVRLSISN